MIVTNIKKQVKRDGRYSVFVDGVYVFALSDLDLSTSGLRVGQELRAEEVEDYRRQAGLEAWYSKAVRLVAIRPRSRREVADYLARKGATPEEGIAVVERLQRAGLVDDAEFAVSWIASRQALRPRSKRRLEQELRQKGLGNDEVTAAIGAVDEEAEYAAVLEVAQKKARLPQYRETDKLMAYLGRQGYPYDLVKRVVASLQNGDEAD